jgi:hypothetical protein
MCFGIKVIGAEEKSRDFEKYLEILSFLKKILFFSIQNIYFS